MQREDRESQMMKARQAMLEEHKKKRDLKLQEKMVASRHYALNKSDSNDKDNSYEA